MFCISFDPNIGKFIVQVLKMQLFWKTIQSGDGALTFATFDEAQKYVSSIGLDKLYSDRSANCRRLYMAAQA